MMHHRDRSHVAALFSAALSLTQKSLSTVLTSLSSDCLRIFSTSSFESYLLHNRNIFRRGYYCLCGIFLPGSSVPEDSMSKEILSRQFDSGLQNAKVCLILVGRGDRLLRFSRVSQDQPRQA